MSDYIKGVEQAIKKLQTLKKSVARKAIRKGTRAGAKIVQSQAKALAPVRTGELARGIKVRALPRSRKWTGTMVRLFVAGSKTFYASFIELGTKFIKARHFLRTAQERVKGQAINTAVDVIKQEIEKI